MFCMNKLNKNIDYWVACSAGVDSVVLVRLFKALNKNFGILHCNFKLRGEASDEDESFVRSLSNEINAPLKVKVFDIPNYIKNEGGNTQLAARNLRYQWFEEIKTETNGEIVLGHHKDDQIETFFLQLKRGGKLRGLSCMSISHNGYIRPLLKYSKEDIYALAKNNAWLWREDLSNQKSDYLRNFYRNELIPILKISNINESQVVELVKDFQILLNNVEDYLTSIFDFTRNVEVHFEQWDSWPFWVKHLFASSAGIAPISVDEIDKLRRTQKGKYLSNHYRTIWNEGNCFLIKSEDKTKSNLNFEINTCSISEVSFNNGEIYIDYEKVGSQISLREWREGDKFQPLGMKGQKKVAKFLRDKKIPSSSKKNFPLVVDVKGNIVGVAGICPDERYKLDESTKWVFHIKEVF